MVTSTACNETCTRCCKWRSASVSKKTARANDTDGQDTRCKCKVKIFLLVSYR